MLSYTVPVTATGVAPFVGAAVPPCIAAARDDAAAKDASITSVSVVRPRIDNRPDHVIVSSPHGDLETCRHHRVAGLSKHTGRMRERNEIRAAASTADASGRAPTTQNDSASPRRYVMKRASDSCGVMMTLYWFVGSSRMSPLVR